MRPFEGKRFLVTGSTRGLGFATAKRLLEEGATVVLHGRSEAAAMAAIDRLPWALRTQVHPLGADLLDRTATDRLAGETGDVDCLVNCAGIFEDRMLSEADEDHWDRQLEVNLTAPWRLSRRLLRGIAMRRGVIVNVSSDAGLLGYAGSVAYCASKGALIGLTRALATELAPAVRVVCVCPGPIDTDMMRQGTSGREEAAAVAEQWQSFTLLKRVATAEEIAEAVVFAASPACSYQTGSLIVVDGGATAGRRVGP